MRHMKPSRTFRGGSRAAERKYRQCGKPRSNIHRGTQKKTANSGVGTVGLATAGAYGKILSYLGQV